MLSLKFQRNYRDLQHLLWKMVRGREVCLRATFLVYSMERVKNHSLLTYCRKQVHILRSINLCNKFVRLSLLIIHLKCII
jgi:hypothetical protein